MARVLITGGAGFIGSHITRLLMDAGHETLGVDFYQQYIHPLQPTFLENMNYRFEVLLKGANLVRVSTLSSDSLRRVIDEFKPTHVIHLAALPLANISIHHPEEAFDTIIKGTVNMLEAMRDQPQMERFVFTSSSMIYGDFEKSPQPEDARKEPKEIYGGMKLSGEILTKVYSQRYGIPYNIVRPSAVFGPTDNNRRVLQIFVENAFRKLPIRITNPETRLDFTYVKDAAQGFIDIAFSNAPNEAFNLTRGQPTSLREAAQAVKSRFPDLVIEERIKTDTYRPERGALDIAKAVKLAGYSPKYDVETGLNEYVDYMRRYNPSITEGK
ncbi:MAG: NAD-dependent epimerase/dehydratase family protein [Desulfovibrio sp.]